jgi:hypothetical protein
MRHIKTYKLFESELSKNDTLKEEIIERLEDIKIKLDGDVSVSKYDGDFDEVFIIDLNASAYEMKGSDSDHEDTVEFILNDKDIADIKSIINYLESEGYNKIQLCISKDGEDNFEELDEQIDQTSVAKERLDNIIDKPIECMQIYISTGTGYAFNL